MKETIKKLKNEKLILLDRVKLINNAIEAFQNVCNHKKEDGSDSMEYEGNNSHKNYYKCTICDYENWN